MASRFARTVLSTLSILIVALVWAGSARPADAFWTRYFKSPNQKVVCGLTPLNRGERGLACFVRPLRTLVLQWPDPGLRAIISRDTSMPTFLRSSYERARVLEVGEEWGWTDLACRCTPRSEPFLCEAYTQGFKCTDLNGSGFEVWTATGKITLL